MIIIGIDPGLTGAIAAYDVERQSAAVWDIPTVDTKKKSKVKRVVDARGVADVFDAILHRDPDAEFVMESVNAMPGQGVVSVFSLGDTFGCLRGVIGAMGFTCQCVHPATWKPAMELTSEKRDSLNLARDLFPSMAELARAKDHNRAEALLLAVWRANQLEA